MLCDHKCNDEEGDIPEGAQPLHCFGSLGGQFNDNELAGDVAFKKRQHGPFHSLHAVVNVGKQENGTWVLNWDMFFDREGQRITPAASGSMWIAHLQIGLGGAAPPEELEIACSRSTSGLTVLINEMEPLFGGVYMHRITTLFTLHNNV